MIAGFPQVAPILGRHRPSCSSPWSRSSSPASAPAAAAGSAASAAAGAAPTATSWPRSRARRSPRARPTTQSTASFAAAAPAAADARHGRASSLQGAYRADRRPADRRRRDPAIRRGAGPRRLAGRWSTARSSTMPAFRNAHRPLRPGDLPPAPAAARTSTRRAARRYRPRPADPAPAARPGRGSAAACRRASPALMRTCCSSGGAGTIGVVPAGADRRPGSTRPTPRSRAILPRNRAAFTVPERRVIKYAVIGAEQVARRRRRPRPRSPSVYRNTPRYYGRARRGRCNRSSFADASAQARAGLRAARARRHRLRSTPPGRPASRPRDVTFADQSRSQFARRHQRRRRRAGLPRRAGRGRRPDPLAARLPRRPGRAGHRRSPARPLETVRGDIAREHRAAQARRRARRARSPGSRTRSPTARASRRWRARARLTIVTTPPITARGQPVSGQPWHGAGRAQRRCSAPPSRSTPRIPSRSSRRSQENARYALLGVDRVEPAAPPPLAQIRDRVRAPLIQRAALGARRAGRRRDRRADQRRHAAPPAPSPRRGPACPPPSTIDLRRQRHHAAPTSRRRRRCSPCSALPPGTAEVDRRRRTMPAGIVDRRAQQQRARRRRVERRRSSAATAAASSPGNARRGELAAQFTAGDRAAASRSSATTRRSAPSASACRGNVPAAQ